MDDDALGKLLAEVHRDYADYRRAEGASVSPSSMSVMVDRTGEPVSHHEHLAAQAEQECRILQEELLRQQQDFREVHQQDLTTMKELQKFQNSTFDELTRQKFIEDQSTIIELSGRLQELQNEVNCMNDSKDFQDAESVRSGNSHVTSQPGVFPKHPPFEGLLRPSFVSLRHTDGPQNIWDASGISGNVFAHPQASSSAPYPQELISTWRKTIEEPIHMSTAQRSGRPERDQDLRCQSGPPAKDSVEETLQRIMEQTNNDCRFRISILTSSLRQQPLLAGRKGSRPRYVLVHNFLRKRCNGSRKWSCLIQWMN